MAFTFQCRKTTNQIRKIAYLEKCHGENKQVWADRGAGRLWGTGVTALNVMLREDLTEKVTLEQSPKEMRK